MTEEYFSIGSRVLLQTSSGKDVTGEVLAFDPISKMLILKNKASSGRTSLCDVRLVNLHQVRDIKVLDESRTEPPSPSSLNTERLKKRVQAETEKKKLYVQALAAGVSVDGQQLFAAVRKTIDDVSWDGVNIIVQNEIKITPPYTTTSIVGNPESKAYIHVRKIIEKHSNDVGASSEQ